MNARLFFVAVVGLVFAPVELFSAEVPDLADLAPARTLAYLELHNPPALARELHALIKGSYLQHPALFLANQLKQGKKVNEEALLLAWFCSPEFIDELGDWQGGFLALTGLTRNEEPEMVGLLRTGRSRMFPLAVRMLLLESGPIHCIARVEGVPIFQIGEAEKRPQPEIAQRLRAPAVQLARLLLAPRRPSLYQVALLDDAPADESEEKPDSGFFVSLLSDAVAFGTTPEILAEAIRRYKNKSSTPSLAAAPAFRAATSMRRTGLFGWSDPPRLARLINDALRRELDQRKAAIRAQPPLKDGKTDVAKLREMLKQAEIEHRREIQEWTFLQRAANFTAMQFAAAGWSLHKGEVAFRIEARMKAQQTCPLLDALANQKISPDLLRATPGNAFLLFALPLSDGAATLARVMKLADNYVAESGDDASLPSKQLAELEKTLKLRLGRDVLAKIRTAALAMHLVEGKEISSYPLFVLEAVSENAAQDLVAVWPRLCSSDGKRLEPHQHTIKDQRVFSFSDKPEDANTPWPPPQYGRRGKIVVLGWHRDRVAATLRECTQEKNLLNLPSATATVDAEGAVSALGLFSCRQLLTHLAQIGSTAANQDAGHRRGLSYLRELSAPMATMSPTLFTVNRLTDGVRIEFRQRELPVASATVVDIGLTWLLDSEVPAAWLALLFGSPQPANQIALPAAPPAAPAPAAPVPNGN